MSYRYRLVPDASQIEGLERNCSDARFVWNLALEQANYHRPDRPVSQWVWERELTEARKDSWLGEGSSSVQQAALRDLRQAFRNWWGNPGHYGRPTWRRRGINEGFVIRDLRVKRLSHKWAEVTVPKVGRVKFRLTRPVPVESKSARVTLDRSGRWHVSFTSPQPPVERCGCGSVGLDLGIVSSVTTSDGEFLRMPDLLSPGEVRRKLQLQRRLARQQKGSKRRCRTKRSYAKVCAREADRRKDWIEKTTTNLVRYHDFVAVEDLKVKNMTRSARGTIETPGVNVAAKRGLNRSIQSQGWGIFRKRLTDKCAASGVELVAVNPANTSRRCAACEHVAKESRENQATFRCVACRHEANADVNAAVNILAAGLAVSGRGGTQSPVETSTPLESAPCAN